MLLQVKSRMSTYVNTSIFQSDAVRFTNYEVRDSFCQMDCSNSRLSGTITLECQEKKDTLKYGGPGFKGNENGEVCQYPDYGSTYYQWDALRCRWKDVSQQICNSSTEEPGFFDKLLNNAAFEPLWGNTRTGEDIFGNSGREVSGQRAWGSPQMRKPMGTFKQISGGVFKSVYRFTLDLRSAISYYLRIDNAFNNTKSGTTAKSDTIFLSDSIAKVDEPMVTMKIARVNHWSFQYKNGKVEGRGSLTEKDTSVYARDISKVEEEIKKYNTNVKAKAYDKYTNSK